MNQIETQSPNYSSHWQDLAHGYDQIMGNDPTMGSLFKVILEELPSKITAALDLGTGTGTLLKLIRERYQSSFLVGLDPAEAMLDQARSRLGSDENIEFILGSANRINYLDSTFDVVVSNFALHHLTHNQKQECALEVFRVLTSGGRFVFGDQHCRRMGTPDDLSWVEDIFDLFSTKARYYLHTAGFERMMLQVKLLPRFLAADGEIPATTEYWQNCLEKAGFIGIKVIVVQPEFLYNRCIVATKP